MNPGINYSPTSWSLADCELAMSGNVDKASEQASEEGGASGRAIIVIDI